jgi:predicted DNA-binding protein (MmcQ/YjbR family)
MADLDSVRRFCLALPGTTEQIQWGDALLFKVCGKMFAISSLEPGPTWLTIKASPESFAELTERPGIIPAPYLARAKWVALETSDALTQSELEPLIRASYDMVVGKLPRSAREKLTNAKPSARTRKPHKKSRHKLSEKKRR